MSFVDYLSNLGPDGSLKNDQAPWRNDNFPRLLQFQFLCATANFHRNPNIAYQLLEYVCSITKAGKQNEFNLQASTLLMSLVSQTGPPVTYVPAVNLISSRIVLQSRLLAAGEFEKHFQNFIAQEKTSKQLGSIVTLMFNASDDATSEYAFTGGLAKKSYDTAVKVYDTAVFNFQKMQKDLDTVGDGFKVGIEKWATAQKLEAVKETLYAIINVACAVAVCVATAGAAPAAAVSIGGTAKTGSETSGMVETLRNIFEKLKRFADKVEPVLKEIQKLTEVTKKLHRILTDVVDLPEMSRPSNHTNDELNTTAEWDIFTIEIDNMFAQLKGQAIGGMDEYHEHLRKLPVLGKAVLAAQMTVIQSGDHLMNILMKQKQANSQRERIHGANAHASKDNRVLDMLKFAMFDRLLVIRGLIFMDFWSQTMGYMYHSMSEHPPLVLSPTKPAHDYFNDAAKLEAAIVGFGSRTKIQTKRFTIQFTGNLQQMKDALLSESFYRFTLSHANPLFQQFCRIRMQKARCYLEGITTQDPDDTVKILLQTSSRFTDKAIVAPQASRAFMGEAREMFFEYNPGTREITCDGEYIGVDACAKQTPFTDWMIGVQSDNLSFVNFSGIRLDLWCEVTLIKTMVGQNAL